MVEVRVVGLCKAYGRVQALRDVTLTFASGALTAVLGPSGCGKTTLLRSIAGFVAVDAGRIAFGGEEVTHLAPQRRGTAMVFQNYALWPHMTVFDNVAYGLRLQRVREPELTRRVQKVLELVEIGDLEDIARRRPGQLSGGQQQRVALARALVVEPRVLLMDEPLSNLDAKVRQRLRAEVRRLQRAVGITAIYVTHDQEEALALADVVVLLDRGEVVQAGTPEEIYQRPRNAFAAEFLGVSNVLEGTARAGGVWIGGQQIGLQAAREGPVVVVFRAGDARAGPAEGMTGAGSGLVELAGTVTERLFLGAVYRHYVRIDGGSVMADSPEPWPHGDVRLQIPRDRVQVYPRA
jgi:ABC-type Fe3+/spermidine/putrescine transport system ATPase subunit